MIKLQRHITKKEISELYGISISTIDRYRKNDPSFPNGKKITKRTIRFSEKDIQEWINSKADPESIN